MFTANLANFLMVMDEMIGLVVIRQCLSHFNFDFRLVAAFLERRKPYELCFSWEL